MSVVGVRSMRAFGTALCGRLLARRAAVLFFCLFFRANAPDDRRELWNARTCDR